MDKGDSLDLPLLSNPGCEFQHLHGRHGFISLVFKAQCFDIAGESPSDSDKQRHGSDPIHTAKSGDSVQVDRLTYKLDHLVTIPS
jgi:hypothetical protein